MAAKKKKNDKIDKEAQRSAARARRQKKHDARRARLIERTKGLLGKHVQIRVKDGSGDIKKVVGTVKEIIQKGDDEYPTNAKRKMGSYLKVSTNSGDHVVSRHRVKPV